MLGTTVDGKYRILRTLGVGGMGAVYEAEHTGTGRKVALKVITSDLARTDENIGRFQREARAAGVLDTQYIAQVLDTGVDRDTGMPFLVMELLSGEDFLSLLKRTGPIAPDLALRITAQACLGLQKAHEAGVVHRDIKPANMFLARREAGEVITKLVDFGIAKVRDQAQETSSGGLTKTGSLLGSPFYMSPEQALGSREIDHRTDLWSLGVALYHALAGRTPFEHIPALGQLIVEISYGRLPPVQEAAPWVPPQVTALVHAALQRNPNERFQSAAAMFEAIRSLLPHGWNITADMLTPVGDTTRARVEPRFAMPSVPEGSPSSHTSPGDPSPLAGAKSSTATGITRSQVVPSPRPSAVKTAVAASLAVVTMGAGGGYLLWGRSQPAPPVEQRAETSPAQRPTPVEAATPAPPVAPPSASASASVSAPAPQPSTRTVEVVFFPPDASVEVEGQRVPTKNGIFEITGTLGSLHKVRVFKFSYETVDSVIVTEAGPRPSKIELTFGAIGPQQPRGSLTPRSTANTPQGTTPGAKRKFE